jgi:positive regulator of sigma E activity
MSLLRGRLRFRLRHETAEGTAAGVYGLIVGSSVLVTAHAETAYQLDIIVLVTLTIYWAAERYARIVAERIHEGHRPAWHVVREQLTSGWEIISLSVLPLLALLLARAVGARLNMAILVALICSTVLLGATGWYMGAKLSQAERVASALVATTFGAVMIALKILLH